MSKSRPNSRLRPLPSGSPIQPATPSLPLAPDGSTDASTSASIMPETLPGAKKPKWYAPAHGVRYEKAMRLRELRQLGMSEQEIATEMGTTPAYLKLLTYTAGKNRWFAATDWESTKERIDNDIIPRALDQLSSLIDHRDPGIRMHATLEALKGTAFKSYDQQHAAVAPPTIVGIRIEMPPGPRQEMREGVLEAAPAYDAEIVE